jgi:hypothetical protein
MRGLVNQPCKLLTRSAAEPQRLGAVQRQDTEKSIVVEDRETQETREPVAPPPVSADKARISEEVVYFQRCSPSKTKSIRPILVESSWLSVASARPSEEAVFDESRHFDAGAAS